MGISYLDAVACLHGDMCNTHGHINLSMSVICAQSGEEQRKNINSNVNDRYDIAEVFLLSYAIRSTIERFHSKNCSDYNKTSFELHNAREFMKKHVLN